MQIFVHIQKVYEQAVTYSNLSNVLEHQRKVFQEQRLTPVMLKQQKNSTVKYLF